MSKEEIGVYIKTRFINYYSNKPLDEVFIRDLGWFTWNKVYKTYNNEKTNELLKNKDAFKIQLLRVEIDSMSRACRYFVHNKNKLTEMFNEQHSKEYGSQSFINPGVARVEQFGVIVFECHYDGCLHKNHFWEWRFNPKTLEFFSIKQENHG